MNEGLKALKDGHEVIVISRCMSDDSHIYWMKNGDLDSFTRSFGVTQLTTITPERLSEMLSESEEKDTHLVFCRG